MRRKLSLKAKLAATLLKLGHIPYEHSKQMTADQIISLFHFDHWPIRHADGGPDEPWNLEPRLIADHREKTAVIDVPQIAKGKRIRGETRNGPRRKIPARVDPWPAKGSRPLQSRNSFKESAR